MNIVVDIQYKSGNKDTCHIWFDEYKEQSQNEEFIMRVKNKIYNNIKDNGLLALNNKIINFNNVECIDLK